jgi:hypothetical protein
MLRRGEELPQGRERARTLRGPDPFQDLSRAVGLAEAEEASAARTFAFRVHSPSRSGLVVGGSYDVEARWTGDGYLVDGYQWRPRRSVTNGRRS